MDAVKEAMVVLMRLRRAGAAAIGAIQFERRKTALVRPQFEVPREVVDEPGREASIRQLHDLHVFCRASLDVSPRLCGVGSGDRGGGVFLVYAVMG